MPMKAPRICGCGYRIAAGSACPCETKRAAARKARSDARRPNSTDRGYDGAWRAARADWLRSHPSCAMCSAPATVVDHIVPHRGDRALFWRQSNWQSLCQKCHSGPKQRAEALAGGDRQLSGAFGHRRGDNRARLARIGDFS